MNCEIKEGDYLICHTRYEYASGIIERDVYVVVYVNNTFNKINITLRLGQWMSFSLEKDNKHYYKKWFHTMDESRAYKIDKLLELESN